MKKHKNQNVSHIRYSILVSFLIHLFLLLIFAIIRFGNLSTYVPEYSTINFSETPASVMPPQTIKKEKHFSVKKIEVEKAEALNHVASVDTIIEKKDTVKISLSDTTSNEKYLKLAETLLDTFLIRNPQYASMVLKQQAKALAYKKFSRETLIKRINDELHEYIKKNFPEGSEHELNPYTGPGIQIPIDNLINIVKDIFQ